jgi:hypothetical protein
VTATSTNLTAYSDTGCTTVSSVYEDGSIVYINGLLELTGTKTGVAVLVEVRKSLDDSLVGTPLDTTHDFEGGSAQFLTDITGGDAPYFDMTGMTEGEYYIKLTVSGTGITTLYDYEDFRIDIPVRITSQVHDVPSPYTLAWHESVRVTATITFGGATSGAAFARVNGKAFAMSVLTGSTYYADIKGAEIGECTSTTIYVYAGASDGEGDYAICAHPITVTVPDSGIESTFNQVLIIEPFAGNYNDSGEALYDTGSSIPCMIVQKNSLVIDGNGEQVVSSTQIYIAGYRTITALDRITLPDGTHPKILSVESNPGYDGNPELKVIFT